MTDDVQTTSIFDTYDSKVLSISAGKRSSKEEMMMRSPAHHHNDLQVHYHTLSSIIIPVHISTRINLKMFAEELGGNANRRKQEEARARRRKLKQEEEQKKKADERARQQKEAAAAAAQGNGSTGNSTPIVTVGSSSVPSPALSPAAPTLEIPATAEAGKNAAVANALQQRQQRQAAQHLLQSAVKIQSFYRAHRSNVSVLQSQSTLLGQRLQDLNTLTTLLKQQAPDRPDYVPPPATATALCLQLLFLTRSLPYRSKQERMIKLRNKLQDAKYVQQMIRLVLLPGICSHDENSSPFLVWQQSKLGLWRIESLMRLVFVTAMSSAIDESTVAVCLDFLRALSGAGDKPVPASISALGQSRLWSTTPPATSLVEVYTTATRLKTMRISPVALLSSPLDWIGILRFHLLYQTGGPDPIPKAAEQAREACIPTPDKIQADHIFRAALQSIRAQTTQTLTALQLRFVSDILTIPLLTWKISDASIHLLLAPSEHSDSNNKRPFLVDLLATFIQFHADKLSGGEIGSILCNDTSLTVCPATPTQCLLANLLQIGRTTPALNGVHPSKLHFAAATTFYQFIATLVDAVPLATLTSRESVVEWISDGKGHHSPVVLSSIVMEQCKYLLVDGFVRKLLDCAIDSTALSTESILQQKNDKDLKQEAALREAGMSAASLAAKEARVDRSKGFWNSSAWAKRLKGGVSKLLTNNNNGNANGVAKQKGDGGLIDASSVSRQLAKGEGKTMDRPPELSSSSPSKATRVGYTPALLKALCRLYGIVLARWGGRGGTNVIRNSGPLVRKDSKGAKQEIAMTSADPCTQTLLNNFIFSTSIIETSWALIQSDPQVIADVYCIIDPSKGRAPVRSFSIQPYYGKDSRHLANSDGAALLFIFVSALSHILIVTDDTEIHEMGKPLPLHQLRRCIQTLKQLLYRACCVDDASLSVEEEASATTTNFDTNYFGLALIKSASKTMTDLYDRSSRRPLAVPKLWLIDDLLEKEIRRCKSRDDYVNLLSTPVLRVCPFLVSFKRRLKLFERIVTTDRVAIQGENSQNPFHNNPLKPGIPVRITRGRILEDGLATMNNLGRNMRQRLSVQYYNEAGTRESGIDAGGLFKEFWTDLCAIAFDPNYALFRVTEENCMYPNPSSGAAHGSDHITLFEFLGRILGKALYEGITVHPQFAHFFLSHLRGDYKYLNMLSDLSTMDSQLYNNIMFLKTYDGDAEDLCLSFTVTLDDFGGNREIPLIPNGANIEVTNANKQRYIQLVAKYYVVDRIQDQAKAFTKGLREVIDKTWLQIFNEPELQVLISGASDGKIDVEDMRSNCRYAGGFTGIDRTVNRFWNVVASMDSKQQGDLLRFVTSCERPPPLGFGSLNPPLTIQRVGILRDGDRLPTSSTCFNVLKLPTYSSEKVMKERLLYAIQSGAGFELS